MLVNCTGKLFDVTQKIKEIPNEFEEISEFCYKENTVKIEISKKLKLLDFYNFIDAEKTYINELACEIGEYIEKNQIEINENVKKIILENYPILKFYKKYGGNNIDFKLAPKYATKHFHENVKSFDISIYCEFGNLTMVKYLYQGENKNSLLKIACENDHLEIVEFLVSNDIDINFNNGTLLKIACYNGHLEIAIGADISIDNDIALRCACCEGHIEIVELLVSKGANVIAQKDYGLRIECFNTHFDVVKFLISNGADINAENSEALKWACYREEEDDDHIAIVEFLVSKGADINAGEYCSMSFMLVQNEPLRLIKTLKPKDEDEYSCALGTACIFGLINIAKILISNGANVNLADDYALRQTKNFEIIKYLIEHGANVRAGNDYALRRASKKGELEMVKFLIANGANVNADKDYSLRYAAMNGHLEVVKFLVSKGAKTNNKKILKLAIKNKQTDIVNFLKSKGAK